MDVEMQIPMYKEGDAENVPTAVVSVFFMAGLANYHSEFLQSLGIAGVDTTNADTFKQYVARDVNFGDFMNELDVSTYYEYSGSLTQPPCTEGITWYVIPAIQNLSKKQMLDLKSMVGTNNRLIQDDNARKVF